MTFLAPLFYGCAHMLCTHTLFDNDPDDDTNLMMMMQSYKAEESTLFSLLLFFPVLLFVSVAFCLYVYSLRRNEIDE